MRRRTTVGLAAAALLVLGGLAGCSGSDKGTAEPAGSSASSSASAAATPSGGATTATTAPGGLTKAQLVAALEAATTRRRSSHVTMDMNTANGAMSAEGDVSYRRAGSDLRMTMQMASLGRVEMRLVDGVLYISMPPMTPKGTFLKVDPHDRGGPFAGMFAGLDRQLDPSSTFGAFAKGLRKVDYLGKETVHGEPMGHYLLTVDTSTGLRALGQQAPGGLPKTMTYDLWLDRHHLMRRVQMQLSGLSMDMTMSRWGEKVRVSAPPRSAIVTSPRSAG